MMARGSHPLWQLTRARLVEFVREPGVLFWVFGFPVLMTIGLGLAFRSRPPEKPRVGVLATLTAQADALRTSDDLEVRTLAPEEAARALRLGDVALLVEAADGRQVKLRLDPTRPESTVARLAVDRALQRASGVAPAVDVVEDHVTEPGGRYVDYLVPGLIGLNIMGGSLFGIGYSVVSTRSRKLLKRFAATPMRRSHYLFSFILSRIVFLAAEVGFVLAFAIIAFDLKVQSGWLPLAAVSTLGAMSFAGVSLLVASRTASVEVASGLINAVTLPMWLLSGTFFSYARFPDWLQPVLKALPLTALNDALRSLVNEGATLGALAGPLIVLAVWGVVSFALALRLFRWQ
jgi:ABC-type multidrug transport system permease subunit